ncbi:hypothetical protein [Deinococcus sp.]|uniref:hypothetical protein n=1 Tax=Deinococcus sp. TaxID=47478 RepID=UPI0025C1FB0B|nr:hypothetical protein [Deinococcus sp.]
MTTAKVLYHGGIIRPYADERTVEALLIEDGEVRYAGKLAAAHARAGAAIQEHGRGRGFFQRRPGGQGAASPLRAEGSRDRGVCAG